MENNKSKTIRVSANTIEMLGKNREGFETPDECLQRILSKNDCSKSKHDDDVKNETSEEK